MNISSLVVKTETTTTRCVYQQSIYQKKGTAYAHQFYNYVYDHHLLLVRPVFLNNRYYLNEYYD